MKVPPALGMGLIGLLDKDSAISKMVGLGGDDAAKAKAAEDEEKKKKEALAQNAPNVPMMKRGGSVSRRADGCAKRGRTRGKIC